MLKNTLTVLRGTAAAQLIGFLALPILARLYSPEAFGLFQLYQSVLAPLLVIAAMRFEIALLRAEDGVELATVLNLCFLVNVVVTLAVTLVCGFAWIIPGALSPTTTQIVWLIPIGVLVGGGLQTIGYLALRQCAFSQGAKAKMAQAGGYVSAGIGMGALITMPNGLVISDLVGRISSIITFGLQPSFFSREIFKSFSRSELLSVARKFRELPLISAPGQLINSAGGVMSSVLMYSTFDAVVAGHYGLVERSLLLPVGMITASLSQVFTSELSTALRNGGVEAPLLFRALVRRMFYWGIIPSCLIGLLAPSIFEMIFGSLWIESGEFARLMSPLILVALVAGPVNMAITILGWQKVQMGWEISRLVLISTCWLGVAHFHLQPHTAVALHVGANITMYLAYLWLANYVICHRKFQYKSTRNAINL